MKSNFDEIIGFNRVQLKELEKTNELLGYFTQNRYICIDFETANLYKRWSVCAIGMAIIEDGKVANTFYTLINPGIKDFSQRNMEINHITPKDVKGKPNFEVVWGAIDTIIDGDPIIAHNTSFEKSCINACGERFGTNTEYEYVDTLRIAKLMNKDMENYKLDTLCEHYNIPLEFYHCAKDDAEACANLFLKLKEEFLNDGKGNKQPING